MTTTLILFPFDHVIAVPSDGLSWLAFCRAYNTPIAEITAKEDNVHEFGFFYNTNDNGLRMGVNDGYTSYWTLWHNETTERGMTYEKWGDAPDQSGFQPLEGDFTITNETLNEFNYTTTGTFHYLTAGFQNVNAERGVWWSTLRPIGSFHAIMEELPAQLVAHFPKLADLDLNENLDYTVSTFCKTTTEKAVDLYIERKHTAGQVLLEGETWSLNKK